MSVNAHLLILMICCFALSLSAATGANVEKIGRLETKNFGKERLLVQRTELGRVKWLVIIDETYRNLSFRRFDDSPTKSNMVEIRSGSNVIYVVGNEDDGRVIRVSRDGLITKSDFLFGADKGGTPE